MRVAQVTDDSFLLGCSGQEIGTRAVQHGAPHDSGILDLVAVPSRVSGPLRRFRQGSPTSLACSTTSYSVSTSVRHSASVSSPFSSTTSRFGELPGFKFIIDQLIAIIFQILVTFKLKINKAATFWRSCAPSR